MNQSEDRCKIIFLPAIRAVTLSCIVNYVFDICLLILKYQLPFSFDVFALMQYNFEGRYDLVKFVKLAGAHGLYFFLRIGPYACAEWNFGSQPFIYHHLAFFCFLNLMCPYSKTRRDYMMINTLLNRRNP